MKVQETRQPATTVYFEDMSVGQSVSLTRIVTERDIASFADLSGDYNPIHVDKAFGKASRFGGNIAHGIFTASLVSTLLGMQLPGVGTIYLGQSMQFKAPVRPGDELVVSVTIRELVPRGRRVILDCLAKVGDVEVLTGEATVLAPKKPLAA